MTWYALLSHPANAQAARTLAVASLALFTLPFAALFAVYWLVQASPNAVLYAGLAAALVVQGIIAGVIYVAYYEQDAPVHADEGKKTR